MEKIKIIEIALEIIMDYVIPALAANSVISESMPFIKKWKSNGTVHLIGNIFKTVLAKKDK